VAYHESGPNELAIDFHPFLSLLEKAGIASRGTGSEVWFLRVQYSRHHVKLGKGVDPWGHRLDAGLSFAGFMRSMIVTWASRIYSAQDARVCPVEVLSGGAFERIGVLIPAVVTIHIVCARRTIHD